MICHSIEVYMNIQETLEYLIAHLDKYGNVYLKKDPARIKDEL